MRKFKVSMLLCFFLILSSCSWTSFENFKSHFKTKSKSEQQQRPDINEKIGEELKEIILSEFNPSETVLNLIFEENNPLAPIMENKIKFSGFGRSKDGLPTIFTIYPIDVDTIILSVSIGDKTFSRIYYHEIQTNTLVPESSISKGVL